MSIPRARFVTEIAVLCLVLAAASLLPAEDYQVFDEEDLFNRLHYKEKIRYNGLQYILNDQQKRQYLSLETWDERDEWLRCFWLEMDPTPTTRHNERKKEHFDRVKLAVEKYGCDDPPGWDDRGEVLIRFGLPDSIKRVWSEVNRLEQRWPGEIWYYWSPSMLATFTDPYLSGKYIRSTEAAGQESWTSFYSDGNFGKSSRMLLEDLASMYAMDNPTSGSLIMPKFLPMHIDPDMTDSRNSLNPDAIDFIISKDIRAEMREMVFLHVTDEYVRSDRALYEFHHQIKSTRFIHYPGFDFGMHAYFDITSFHSGTEKLRTEVNFEIPVSEITFDTTGTRLEGEVEIRVKVWDLEMNEITEAEELLRISVPNTEDAKVPAYLPGQIILTLDPGYYRFGLETIDKNSGTRGVFRTNRRLTCGDDLCLSDIQFARHISDGDENSRYRKGNLIVVPYPLHLYRKAFPIAFYFEIYGIDLDKEDFGFYEVEYSVTPTEKKRWGLVYVDQETGISANFRANGFGSSCNRTRPSFRYSLFSARLPLRCM